jgi:alkylhydroperoxidase/carboxymuconolactone decarboxylase family protein YurZ
MTTREELRRDGTALRRRLFGPGAMTHFVPNYADLRAELAFGAVWNRAGLALPDRMIAALAALCSVQRLNHLRRHVAPALDLGLTPRSVVEIFIQCGIYCGLPASEDAMAVAEAVYAERGITLPAEASRDDPIEELERRGRELLESFHGERGYSGYASPDNPVTQALYPARARPSAARAGRGRRLYRAKAGRAGAEIRSVGVECRAVENRDHRDGDPDRSL